MGALLVPNSYSYVGYVTGNVLLVICFFLTLLGGGITWWLFLLFDSPEYPIKTMADIANILGGPFWKHLTIFLQMIAMLLTAASCLITATESVIILRDQRICWAGVIALMCGVLAMLCLFKQLSNLGKACLVASFMNYISLFVQMGYVGEPNWKNAEMILGLTEDTVVTYLFAPGTLVNKLVAISNISYVFAGSIVFPEIISEMRRPYEFWKSMLLAQFLILAIYLIFGNVFYSRQGQFSNSPAVFGISNIKAMKGLSFITFLVGSVQARFYGHLPAKIAYKMYLPKLFKNLKFESKRGTLLWFVTVAVFWICIWIVSVGVPNVTSISSFTSALAMIPLTYVIPYWYNIMALCIKSNAEKISHYDASTGQVIGYQGSFMQHLRVGFKAHGILTSLYGIFSLASLAFAAMGIYGSVEYMKVIFSSTPATSFSCTSPI